MRIGYFDCFSGAAGDMILAALIHAGCPLAALQDVVERLRLPGVTLRAQRVQQGGLAATRVRVESGDPKSHRHLPEILSIISAADLSTRVTERATAVFKRLAEAEAAVHGTSVDAIHFHEVGAADAIVDIVGACAGLQLLELDRIVCSPIPTGYGTVTCDHGVMPVPAPATAELLKGVPLADCDEPMELTTPTGAAILVTLADDFGPLPPMRIASVGYGAGSRVGKTRPNILRLLVGEATDAPAAEHDQVVVLEAAVDDATGQAVAYACERLLAAGALDAHIVPIIMKKGRPAQVLTVLSRPEDVETLERILFDETTTLGVRRHAAQRTKLARETVTVETRFGPIRVKIGRRGDQHVNAWPEYEDCAAAAQRCGVPLQVVQQEALRSRAQGDDPKR